MTTEKSSDRIPEERISAILTRAAELDKEVQATIDRDAIRAAALEAGISLSAVDRALEEYAAGNEVGRPIAALHAEPRPQRRGRVKLSEALKYGAFGIIMGLLATRLGAGAAAPFVGSVLVAGYLSMQDRPTGSVRRFLQLITITVAGALLTFVGDGNEDIAGWTAITWLGLVPLGIAAIKTPARKASLNKAEATS